MLFISITRVVYFGAGDHGWAPMNSDRLCGGLCTRVHACMYACERVRVRACVYARVRVCMRDVFAIYDKISDNNN